MNDPIEDAKRSIDPVLDLWDVPEVSADFDRRLYARIERDVPWWRKLAWPRLAPVAVTAGLVIAVGLWLGQPTPAPRSAAVEAIPADQAEEALHEMELIEEFNRLVRTDLPVDRKM